MGKFGKSYYLEGIEKLKDRWAHCIKLKGKYNGKNPDFCQKKINSCSFYQVNIIHPGIVIPIVGTPTLIQKYKVM